MSESNKIEFVKISEINVPRERVTSVWEPSIWQNLNQNLNLNLDQGKNEGKKLASLSKCIHVTTARTGHYSMVRVHRDTLVKLQKLKRRYHAKSLNQVINKLIDGCVR